MENLENITWLGHASFFFTDEKSGKRIYYVDPFDLHQQNLPQADLIFITHAHYDHCSSEDIKKIMNNATIVIAPQSCFDVLKLPVQQMHAVEPNKSYTVKDFYFQTIPAYNVHPQRLQAHPRENNWVGYIFTLNGKKIYHAGDTDFTPEMKSLDKLEIDVAMMPMGGKFTMDVEEMIEAANTIAAKITIPMHYKRLLGEHYKGAEEKLKKGVTNSKVVILEELK